MKSNVFALGIVLLELSAIGYKNNEVGGNGNDDNDNDTNNEQQK